VNQQDFGFDFEELAEDICRNNHRGEQFSEQANDAAVGSKAAQRQKIVGFLKTEPNGATCDEVEAALCIPHQTCSARFSELKRDGVITAIFEGDNRVSRITRNGRKAGVYRLTNS